MLSLLSILFAALRSMFRSRGTVKLENFALRHQIGVLRRSARKRPNLTPAPSVAPRYSLQMLIRVECELTDEFIRFSKSCRRRLDSSIRTRQPKRIPAGNMWFRSCKRWDGTIIQESTIAATRHALDEC